MNRREKLIMIVVFMMGAVFVLGAFYMRSKTLRSVSATIVVCGAGAVSCHEEGE